VRGHQKAIPGATYTACGRMGELICDRCPNELCMTKSAIGLIWEEMLPVAGGAIGGMSMRMCFNNHPRHSFPWNGLFAPQIGLDGAGKVSSRLTNDLRKYRTWMHKKKEESVE
jgi:hypothetical protein